MDIRDIIIDEEYTIRQVLKKIDDTGKRILLVGDNNNKLKGVITDGDIRRWILKSGDLNVSAKMIINYNPIYIIENEKKQAIKIMKENSINSLPIVDINERITSIVFWDDYELETNKEKGSLDLQVVIMAGGVGSRLYPYTKILPKPLIPIGDLPIVERIINKFQQFGCKNYYLTVNYKKNMIKSYFEDLDKNYEVSYIEEDKPLGTGGSLYFLKDIINKPFFLSNCDILVDADYESIYNYHKKCNNLITMICAIKNIVIPYGVVELSDDGKIDNMVEKPEFSFLTNTGMYLVEPEVLQKIPKNKFINFPDIIEELRNKGENIGVYPITEKCWMDMGQLDEMEKMAKRLMV